MSIKRNILTNYVSQIYVTLIGIIMVPMYVHYMGMEAYGLVGFYAMLQAWFQLLDLGLTPTMARETARFNGRANDAQDLRQLLRALEGIFVIVAFLGAAGIVAGADIIANSWLKVQDIPLAEVRQAIILMALIIALRWVCGLYRGAINGFERITWLSSFNILIATARFVLIVPYFIYVGSSPTHFFSYQLAVAVFEVILLIVKTYRLLPTLNKSHKTLWQWEPVRRLIRFSLSIAFTSSVWVVVTQTDKLVLSNFLSLTEYAFFSLAVLVASGVMVVSTPVSGALLPRLSNLSAKGEEIKLIRLYRDATQLVAMVAIPVALVLAFFAKQVLWAWTGNEEISIKAAPILTLYALGNGLLALNAFPYYLQFAKGDLKLHLIGNALFIVFLIPSLVWATWHSGAVGAGFAWLSVNLIYFLAWVPQVHRRFVKGLHTNWIIHDLMPIFCRTATAGALGYGLVVWSNERITVAIEIVIVSLSLLIVAGAGTKKIRDAIRVRWLGKNMSGNKR